MKTYINLTAIALFVSILTSCGGMMSTTVLHPEEKSSIVSVEGNKKLDLYLKANDWMIEAFNDAESVIQFTDKESGVVTGKYLMHTIINGTEVPREYVYAIIKIQVKDGAAKITINPDSYVNKYNSLAGGKSYPVTKAAADIDLLIASFEAAMMEEIDSF